MRTHRRFWSRAVNRRAQFTSGWCANGFHDHCDPVLQSATEKRREIVCACRCHSGGHVTPDWLWTVVLILAILVLLRYLGAV